MDLGDQDSKSYTLVVRGASYYDLMEYKDLHEELGIKTAHIIKNKDSKVIKICKIDVNSYQTYKQYLNDGKIKISIYEYVIEKVAGPPPRCQKCKKFEHSGEECVEVCGMCGSNDHKDDKCPERKKAREKRFLRCVNCQQNHSSYYKGCQKYKENYKKMIVSQKTNEDATRSINSLEVPKGFTRIYSTAVKSFNSESSLNSNQILEKLNENNRKQTELLEKIDTLTKSCDNFTNLITETNKKIHKIACQMFYVNLDIIKILCPSIKRVSDEIIQSILNVFENHKIESPPSAADISKYLKQWK